LSYPVSAPRDISNLYTSSTSISEGNFRVLDENECCDPRAFVAINKTYCYCDFECLEIVEIAWSYNTRLVSDRIPVGRLRRSDAFAGNTCIPRPGVGRTIYTYTIITRSRRAVIVVSRHEVCDEVNWRKRVGFYPASGKVELYTYICTSTCAFVTRLYAYFIRTWSWRKRSDVTACPRVSMAARVRLTSIIIYAVADAYTRLLYTCYYYFLPYTRVCMCVCVCIGCDRTVTDGERKRFSNIYICFVYNWTFLVSLRKNSAAFGNVFESIRYSYNMFREHEGGGRLNKRRK